MTNTVKAFCNRYRIRVAQCVAVNDNPNAPGWRDAHHYKVTLRSTTRDGRRTQMTVYFSMGYAHCREPEAAEVLDCLAMDSASVENARGFEDWASDLGYDTDSRKAERTFKACEKAAQRLARFLGSETYNELLWSVERL